MIIHRRNYSRNALAFALCFIALAPVSLAAIPDVPENKRFVQDYGGLLDEPTIQRLGEIQKTAFNEHNTPIIVVTIPSMATYVSPPPSIEAFAKQWFDKWQIGTLNREGGANKGMLLLISMGDRKARIELGADWGHKWDDHCKRVMDNVIISRFKAGDFRGGIVQGTQALGDMAAKGPEAAVPTPEWRDRVPELTKGDKISPVSPIPIPFGVLLIGLGALLVIAAIFMPEHRKTLLMIGIGLILGVLLFYIVLAVIAFFLRGRNGEGGFGGGGGFSGGFSGGGGASGSW